MPHFELKRTFSNQGTRNAVRRRVVRDFLKEKPGKGRGDDATHYTYYVEQLSSGSRIYLERPGFLNKQFDFVIKVEGVDFARGKGRMRHNPTHEDIFADLRKKHRQQPRQYVKLYALIVKVFLCHDIRAGEYRLVRFKSGYPVDLLLGVIKWYFIEQDIAYWNYSGRAMFMSGIPAPRM